MSNEYHIEKVRRRVTVLLAGGQSLDGELFLQPTARYRAGPQDPAELLAEADPFFPLAAAGGPLLVAKDQVVAVQFSGGTSDTGIEGAADAEVDVVCAGGVELRGHLYLETRADRPRLLDFLNTPDQRYITLTTPTAVCVVNCRHVVFVRHRS
jgi:hypothetical protein